MIDERITELPGGTAPPLGDAEWYVIHSGIELGPLSLAELVGRAALGEIEADDVVRKMKIRGRVREIEYLQQQFLPKDSKKGAKQASSFRLGCLEGIWFQSCRLAGRFLGLLLDKLRRVRNAKGTAKLVALVILAIGAILFLLAHGHELFAGPKGSLSFLARFVGYGLFLGIPFLVARRQRASGILAAILFFLAAGFDLALAVNSNVSQHHFETVTTSAATGQIPIALKKVYHQETPIFSTRPVCPGPPRRITTRQSRTSIKRSDWIQKKCPLT